MTAPTAALTHYDVRQRLAADTKRRTVELWRAGLDYDALDASWLAMRDRLVVTVGAGQLAAASLADRYVDRVLAELDVDGGAPDARVRARALSGVASDGRSLDGLLEQPLAVVKGATARGLDEPDALLRGETSLAQLVSTQVVDAGRVAVGMAIATRPRLTGYVRMLRPPSCGRCAVLAGKTYRTNAGFPRHPQCDCVHVPASEDVAGDLTTDPRAYFDSLSETEQTRYFTRDGARAIRDGADVSQVVNARRGALGLSTASGRVTDAEARALRGLTDDRVRASVTRTRVAGGDVLVTSEGTTRRALASTALRTRGGRLRDRAAPRLMPESIYEIATDRDDAVRLLRANGYLIG